MYPFLIRSFLFCLFLGVSVAANEKRVLVLLNNASEKNGYSKYLQSLRNVGYTLDVRGYRDGTLKLQEYGSYHYDNLVIFASEAESFGGSVNLQAILEFVDAGKNVILSASPSSSATIRKLASELGVELRDKDSKVYDHFSFAVREGAADDHTLIASSEFIKSKMILGDDPIAPVLFRGIAATIPSNSELAAVALSAPPTAYSKRPGGDADVVGRAAALVSVVQMRNNARVLVAGSPELFSNSLFDVSFSVAGKSFVSGNKQFCQEASRWVFQDRGVLRMSGARHSVPGREGQPALYVVGEEAEFRVEILEEAPGGGELRPFSGEDVQLEFTMLSPFVRLPLQPLGNGTFALQFKVPDVYGVFKYVIDYNHVGYSRLQLQLQVPVRPFKHNEYERFLTCAGPYYASAASTLVAFLAIGWAFLYHK